MDGPWVRALAGPASPATRAGLTPTVARAWERRYGVVEPARACRPGSRHELGALAFATALRRRGVAVLYLGADVPVASWLDVRARLQPRLLVVAVVTSDDRPAAIEVATALRLDDGTPVAFGGRAAAGAASEVTGSLVLPDSIVAAADRAVALLGT